MKRKDFNAAEYTILLWKRAISDFDAAESIISERESFGAGLFFIHLSIQKMLAANICYQTRFMPLWNYDLTKLARRANVKLTEEQMEFCKILNFYHKEGNYLGLEHPIPSLEQVQKYLSSAKMLISSIPNPLAE